MRLTLLLYEWIYWRQAGADPNTKFTFSKQTNIKQGHSEAWDKNKGRKYSTLEAYSPYKQRQGKHEGLNTLTNYKTRNTYEQSSVGMGPMMDVSLVWNVLGTDTHSLGGG